MSLKSKSLLLLGHKVRTMRQQLGYTQERLAEQCEFDRTYISQLERGLRNPSFINLMKLAQGLGISISELTTGI